MGRSYTLEPTPTRRQCGGKTEKHKRQAHPTRPNGTRLRRPDPQVKRGCVDGGERLLCAVRGHSRLFGTAQCCSGRCRCCERERERERDKETEREENAVQCWSVRFGAVRCCLRLSGAVGACSGGYSILSGAVRCRSALREREGARDREELVTRQRPSAPERAMRPPGEGGAGDC